MIDIFTATVVGAVGIGSLALLFAQKLWKENEEKSIAKWMRELIESFGGHMTEQRLSGWELFSHKGIIPLQGNRNLMLWVYKYKKGKKKLWGYKVICACANPYNIELEIRPESLAGDFGKLLGGQDIEIFNDYFDDRFIIQCNQKLFPLQHFSDEFCRRFSALYASPTQPFRVSKNQVWWTTLDTPVTGPKGTNYVKAIMVICQDVAVMVDQYSKNNAQISKQ